MSGLGFGKNCFLPLTIHILGDQPFLVEMLQLTKPCLLGRDGVKGTRR